MSDQQNMIEKKRERETKVSAIIKFCERIIYKEVCDRGDRLKLIVIIWVRDQDA